MVRTILLDHLDFHLDERAGMCLYHHFLWRQNNLLYFRDGVLQQEPSFTFAIVGVQNRYDPVAKLPLIFCFYYKQFLMEEDKACRTVNRTLSPKPDATTWGR